MKAGRFGAGEKCLVCKRTPTKKNVKYICEILAMKGVVGAVGPLH